MTELEALIALNNTLQQLYGVNLALGLMNLLALGWIGGHQR